MFFKSKLNLEEIKAASSLKLKNLGLNDVVHLPILDEPSFRDDEAVAKRSLAMMGILQLMFNVPNNIIKEWLIENSLINELTDHEKYLLDTSFDRLNVQNQIDLHWTIECLWAFTWMAGKHKELTLNTSVEDTLEAMFPSIENKESIDEFIKDFKLRPEVEIFSLLDFFYRAHWIAENNSKSGIKNDKVNEEIILERRKALKWVCDSSLDWDEISLDT